MEAKNGVPTNFLHWLHQTYTMRWKGALDISTVPGPEHANRSPQWCCTLTASCAVVLDKAGKHVTLQPLQGQGQGKSKKEAEQQAARQVYDALVAQGWYDPEAPPPAKKSGGMPWTRRTAVLQGRSAPAVRQCSYEVFQKVLECLQQPSVHTSKSRAMKFITDSTPANEHNPLAYLDLSIAGQPVGRVVVELFRYKKGSSLEEHAPLILVAVSNFLALCRGVEVGGRQLCFAGCPITRIMTRFMLQAGDVVNRDGTGGAHIHTAYGAHFPDEGLEDKSYRFMHPFMLGCANLGLEDSNSSQFLVTLAPAAQLAGQHTCFGKVLAGYGVLKEVEALCDRLTTSPPCPVVIEAAGELPAGSDLSAVPAVAAGGWPLWPEDQGPPPEGVREAAFRLDIAQQLKAAGNEAYKQGDAATALARYQQAARFLSWTSFKLRDDGVDVDVSPDEQRALWDCEVLLMGNEAAAQLKLGRFRPADETCRALLQRTPNSAKALLRAAQARIGLGPAEYSSAAGYLQQALQQAQEQQLPARDIVEEMHRLRSLQQQHAARQRSRFSAAFAAGLLHHPADDEPPPAAAPPVDPKDPVAAAAAAAGLRHVVVPQGRRVAGPVPAERVLDGGQPVLVDDAWGTHLMVADEDEAEGSGGEEGGAGSSNSSYSRGLMAKLARMGLAGSGYGSSYRAAAASIANDGWGNVEEGYSDSGDEDSSWAGRYVDDSVEPQPGVEHYVSTTPALVPHGAAGSLDVSLQQDAAANGSLHISAGSASGVPPRQGEPVEPRLPEQAEAAQAAAAGVAVAARGDSGQRSYGDGVHGAHVVLHENGNSCTSLTAPPSQCRMQGEPK
ncbi:hypothetical protein COO60DRAFT_1628772 [Scenedesmus sp. NREL 46B-D3]|nr:hypothetical protein COO60DRAFT_1628772 [Scenedesmus sp. NREL 46B-D3]